MHRYKEEHIKMQIVSCQYFSKGGRIREGLQKKANKNDSKFENNLLEWSLSGMVSGYHEIKSYTK